MHIGDLGKVDAVIDCAPHSVFRSRAIAKSGQVTANSDAVDETERRVEVFLNFLACQVGPDPVVGQIEARAECLIVTAQIRGITLLYPEIAGHYLAKRTVAVAIEKVRADQ